MGISVIDLPALDYSHTNNNHNFISAHVTCRQLRPAEQACKLERHVGD